MDALPLPELWRLRTPSCLVRGVAVLKDEGGVAGRVARDDFLLLVCLPLDFVGQESEELQRMCDDTRGNLMLSSLRVSSGDGMIPPSSILAPTTIETDIHSWKASTNLASSSAPDLLGFKYHHFIQIIYLFVHLNVIACD